MHSAKKELEKEMGDKVETRETGKREKQQRCKKEEKRDAGENIVVGIGRRTQVAAHRDFGTFMSCTWVA